MRCSSTIAAGFACLSIKPGDACASPCAFLHNFFDHVSLTARHNVYTILESAWIALSAPTQGMAAQFFRSLDQIGPVYDAAGFDGHLHAQARGVLVEIKNAELGTMLMHVVYPRLSDTPAVLHQLASNLGRHNDKIVASPSENAFLEYIQLACTYFRNSITAGVFP